MCIQKMWCLWRSGLKQDYTSKGKIMLKTVKAWHVAPILLSFLLLCENTLYLPTKQFKFCTGAKRFLQPNENAHGVRQPWPTSLHLRLPIVDDHMVTNGVSRFTPACPAVILGMSFTVESFELEGTFKGHLVQSALQWTGTATAPSGAQSPVQPDLGCFQGWGTHHLPGQPVNDVIPVLSYRMCKSFVLLHCFY